MAKTSFSGSVGRSGSGSVKAKAIEWGNQTSQCVGDPKGGMGAQGKPVPQKGAAAAPPKFKGVPGTPPDGVPLRVGLDKGLGQQQAPNAKLGKLDK